MGLLYGENCVILASTVFDWSTRVTDGQTELPWHIRTIATLSRVKTATRKITELKQNWRYDAMTSSGSGSKLVRDPHTSNVRRRAGVSLRVSHRSYNISRYGHHDISHQSLQQSRLSHHSSHTHIHHYSVQPIYCQFANAWSVLVTSTVSSLLLSTFNEQYFIILTTRWIR